MWSSEFPILTPPLPAPLRKLSRSCCTNNGFVAFQRIPPLSFWYLTLPRDGKLQLCKKGGEGNLAVRGGSGRAGREGMQGLLEHCADNPSLTSQLSSHPHLGAGAPSFDKVSSGSHHPSIPLSEVSLRQRIGRGCMGSARGQESSSRNSR